MSGKTTAGGRSDYSRQSGRSKITGNRALSGESWCRTTTNLGADSPGAATIPGRGGADAPL